MIRLLLVEDHAVLRQGMRALLATKPGIEVVGEAENGRLALDLLPKLKPDVVLMDISMPSLNGIETTRQLHRDYPHIKVIILSMHTGPDYIFQVLNGGASGYVLKQSDAAQVLMAIDAVLAGEIFLSPDISLEAVEEYARQVESSRQDDPELFTSREREVLQLMAEGRSNQQIADQLFISVKTVEAHRSNMMRKLGVTNKTDLIKYAYRKGWASLET
jgi:DNA-binding NarL/FixJ family response regulator